MQNQLTPGQSNLQQSTSNLQPNAGDFQRTGSSDTSSEAFTVLSQNAQTSGLQVHSAKTDPNTPTQTYLPGQSASVWLVPLVFGVAIIAAIVLWSRLRALEPVVEVIEPITEEPKPQAPVKKSKQGKKTTRRQRQTKR
jgi:hypothetical protein